MPTLRTFKEDIDTEDDSDSILGTATTGWWNHTRSRANRILWGLAIVGSVVILAAFVTEFSTKPNQNENSSNNLNNNKSLGGKYADASLDDNDNINQSHPNSSPPTTTLPQITPTPSEELTASSDTDEPTSSPEPCTIQTPVPSGTDTDTDTSLEPTSTPTASPTSTPTASPTSTPTASPTSTPAASPTSTPTASPTLSLPPTYIPGNLTTFQAGLLLSDGLEARIVAYAGNPVVYQDGSTSTAPFHGKPDAGATFPDARPNNPGGFVYVSNSELDNAQGGVGAMTFDSNGNVLNYKMVLTDTNMNCGGGRTPWNTWISCEEVIDTGLIYQVDPTGATAPQVTTLGNAGGRWESFSYDIRNPQRPYFFATEDHHKGTVRRFTPNTVDWDNDPWNMLHGAGVTDYLMIFPNTTNNGGTFQWTNDLNAAKYNARSYYPQSEGIDVYGGQMFLVCKNIRQLFTINMDDGTYSNRTTASGLFDGKPDTLQRILGDSRDLLYFTEEGGVDAGVHARDHLGRFYTILESPVYRDETSGLSFSPDGRFLIVAYQENGLLFQVWRKDGFPFHATYLDVKYHQATTGR